MITANVMMLSSKGIILAFFSPWGMDQGLFIQQIFIQWLACARHCPQYTRYIRKQNKDHHPHAANIPMNWDKK